MIFENEESYPDSFLIGSSILHGEISEDGTKIIAGFANTVEIIDVASKKVENKVNVNGKINDVKFGANGSYAAVTNKNVICIHDGETHKDIALPEEGNVVAIHHRTAYVGTKKGNLLVVDLDAGTVKTTLNISSSKVTALVVGQIKKVLGVGSSNGLLSIFCLETSKLLSNDLKYHNMPINTVSFNADDSMCLTGAHEKDVHLWDLNKLKHVNRFDNASRLCVNVLDWIDSSRFYCVGHDGSIKKYKF